ncbi:uncharacterized protein [Parasteatoda tepidariorum]|uniref:uncharacterized protein n=1 Tax=Parasteatoda tepidariorum TaxID=114398 RepID=UPI0039BD3BCB
MSKSKSSQRRLPPLISVSPVRLTSSNHNEVHSSPHSSSSKYHSKCHERHRPHSPGPGEYLEIVARKIPSRNAARDSRNSNKRRGRPPSQNWSQKIAEYLKKHESFLEHYVLENIALESLERWVIRKTFREKKLAPDSNGNHEKIADLCKWKFFVMADKKDMLQELTSTITTYPNKRDVLSGIARTVASAANASGLWLYLYNCDSLELCEYKNEENNSNNFIPEESLALYAAKNKKAIRLNTAEQIVNSYLVWGGIALHYAEVILCLLICTKF